MPYIKKPIPLFYQSLKTNQIQTWPASIPPTVVHMPLFNVTLLLLSSRDGVYFLSLWIWVGLVICFEQLNAVEVICETSSLSPKEDWQLPLPHYCPPPHTPQSLATF